MAFDVNKALPSEDVIRAAAEKAHVPFAAFKNLIYIESRGNASAQSEADSKGRRAWGLGQLRGPAMQEMGLKWEDRLDPVKNAEAAAGYYGKLLKQAGGDTTLAGLMYYKGAGSDDVKAYQQGRFENISPEGKQRVASMSGTGEKLPANVLAAIPENYTPTSSSAGAQPDQSALQEQASNAERAGGTHSLYEHPDITGEDTGFAPSYRELPTQQSEQPEEQTGFWKSAGHSFEEAYLSHGGYDIEHAGDSGQDWNWGNELSRQVANWGNGLNTNTYLSPETIARVKEKLDYRNYGLTEGRTDAEVNAMLDTWEARIKRQNELAGEMSADTGVRSAVGHFVGGTVGGLTTPSGVATFAVAGGAGKVVEGVGLLGKTMFPSLARTLGFADAVVDSGVLAESHPIVNAALNVAGRSAEGGAVGATFGATDALARQSLGNGWNLDEVKDSAIGGMQMGMMLAGGASLVGEAVGAGRAINEARRNNRPTQSLNEATGTGSEAPTAAPEAPAMGEGGEQATIAPEGTTGPTITPEDVGNANEYANRPQRQQMARDIETHTATLDELNRRLEAEKNSLGAISEHTGERITSESLEQLRGLIDTTGRTLADTQDRLAKSSKGGIHYEAAKKVSRQSHLAKVRADVMRFTGERLQAEAEHAAHQEVPEAARDTEWKRQNRVLERRIAKRNTQIADAHETSEQIRRGSPDRVAYNEHSEVSPETREILKQHLGMTDENIDLITEGVAQSRVQRFQHHINTGWRMTNRSTQSLDAMRNGIRDPAYTGEHTAGRDVFIDGQNLYTMEDGARPEDFPDVQMAEGTVLDGNNPTNPNTQAQAAQMEQQVSEITIPRQPTDGGEPPRVGAMGMLRGVPKAFGSIFTNFRDISSVIYDSNINEFNALAKKYATKATGRIENGTHSMFRLDGNATMEDVIRDVDGLHKVLAKVLTDAERRFHKSFEMKGRSTVEVQRRMGTMVIQAVEDSTGNLYNALPAELKPAVDAIRKYNSIFKEYFDNPRQFNSELTDEQVKEFKTSYDPNNYYTRMVDENLVHHWNLAAEQQFGLRHSDILKQQIVKGYDAQTEAGAFVRKTYREAYVEESKLAQEGVKAYRDVLKRAQAKVEALDEADQSPEAKAARTRLQTLQEGLAEVETRAEELKATLDDDVLRQRYVGEAERIANAMVNLDPRELEVRSGRLIDDELDEPVVKGFKPNTYQKYEGAKVMKQRFPMNTAHEIELTALDGTKVKYSYDSAIRDTDLGATLRRYHRIAGSELANRAVLGKSYASAMQDLDHYEAQANRIRNVKDRVAAQRSIEAMRQFQMVMRKSQRVKNNTKGFKLGKLMQNNAYYFANYSFGLQNATEMGLTLQQNLMAHVARDFPEVFDLGMGTGIKLTPSVVKDIAGDLLTLEMHREFAPRPEHIRESNAIAFGGDNYAARAVAALETFQQKTLHNQWAQRFNDWTGDQAWQMGQMVGLNIVMKDALAGPYKGALRGEKYYDTWRMKPEEYNNLLEMIRENTGIHNGEVRFADRRKFYNTREGYNLRKIMELHGREGLQVQLPGQQTFGAFGPLMKSMLLFKDFARRSINKSIYLAGQGVYNQRKGQMMGALMTGYAIDCMLYTTRSYLQSLSVPEQDREDWLNKRLNPAMYALNIFRSPMLGAVNAIDLPLSSIGMSPLQKLRQTAGFAAGKEMRWDSPYAVMNNITSGLASGAPGVSSALNGAFLLGDTARALSNWSSYTDRADALQDAQKHLQAFTMGNPMINAPASAALSAAQY